MTSSALLRQSTAIFQIPRHTYQSEFFQDRMLPHGVIEDVLHQWVIFTPTVTFGDAHSGRFLFPCGANMNNETIISIKSMVTSWDLQYNPAHTSSRKLNSGLVNVFFDID